MSVSCCRHVWKVQVSGNILLFKICHPLCSNTFFPDSYYICIIEVEMCAAHSIKNSSKSSNQNIHSKYRYNLEWII